MNKSIFTEVLEQGIPFDNHHSDLYIPANAQTTEILSKHPESGPVSTFKNQQSKTLELWYDIPFQYKPYWQCKNGGIPEIESWHETRTPDSHYGGNVCHVTIDLAGKPILFKLPFSTEYQGNFNGYACSIFHNYNHYSLHVRKDNQEVHFSSNYKNLQSAYIKFRWFTHNQITSE